MRAVSVSWTSAVFASWRLRLALLDAIKCRREDCARNTLPVPVTLKRLATAFFVLRRAIGFGMGGGKLGSFRQMTISFYRAYLLSLSPDFSKERERTLPARRVRHPAERIKQSGIESFSECRIVQQFVPSAARFDVKTCRSIPISYQQRSTRIASRISWSGAP